MEPTLNFDEWLAELEAVGKEAGDPYGPSGIVKNTGRECWEGFWEDGYSPREALSEDLSCG